MFDKSVAHHCHRCWTERANVIVAGSFLEFLQNNAERFPLSLSQVATATRYPFHCARTDLYRCSLASSTRAKGSRSPKWKPSLWKTPCTRLVRLRVAQVDDVTMPA